MVRGEGELMRPIRTLLVLGTFLALGCATTQLKSTWKDPEVARVQLQGARVAALVVTDEEGVRRIAEDALARTLAQRGLPTVPGYRIIEDISESADTDRLLAQLKAAGMDAAVVMKVIDRRQEVNYPGPFYGLGYSPGYYWGAWGGGYTDLVVSVETTLYSVPDGKLIWVGVSETIDPLRIESLVKEVGEKAVGQMKKSGLLI